MEVTFLAFWISFLCGGEWSFSCSSHFTPRERALIPVGQDARWAPETVWTWFPD